MSQSPNNDKAAHPTDETDGSQSSSRDADVKVKRPDSTVTIKVTPDHRLFNEDGRQATAPARRPALHVNPSRPVSGMDPHRTQQMVRRDASDSQKPIELYSAANPPTTSPLATNEADVPEEEQGMDTLALDESMKTIMMEDSGDTLIETGWRCPDCSAPNRHMGGAPGADVVCDHCGSKSQLSDDIIAPLEPRDSEEAEPSTVIQGRSFIGKYTLDRFLGRGGMGEVWLGRHPNLDIPVAIKIMNSDLMARNPSYLERFLSEARTAAQMNHPNVVRIYDADHQDGLYFIVLEYMDGGDVLQLARSKGGKLAPEEALRVVIAVADALHEAARYNIIHRDIKPENIMRNKAGVFKLADLGIAKRIVGAHEAEHFTFTNMILGTPAYISPEQALNASDVDMRADIYSLGATFYQLVTGSIPFPAKSPFQMMYKHVKEPLVTPMERNAGLPENICAVICKMMEKDPMDRYQDSETLLADLRRIRDRDASVMQLQASQIPAHTPQFSMPAIEPASTPRAIREERKLNIWQMAPVQLAIGAAIASLAVILGLRMAPEPIKNDGMTTQLRNAVLQARRTQAQPRQQDLSPTNGSAHTATAPEQTDPSTPPLVTPPVVGPPNEPAPVPPTVNKEAVKLTQQAELDKLQHKEFEARLAETEEILKRVENAKLNPANGVAGILLEAQHALGDAKGAATGRQWEIASTHLNNAIRHALKAESTDRDRQAAQSFLSKIESARRAAIAAGATELKELDMRWTAAEKSFESCNMAMQNNDFRQVSRLAADLQAKYQHIEAQAPAIRDRSTAAATFHAAYKAANLERIQELPDGAQKLAEIEKLRRIADAETIRHTEAARGYKTAALRLQAASAAAAAHREQQKVESAKAAADAARKVEQAKETARWQTYQTGIEKLLPDFNAAVKDPRRAGDAVQQAGYLQSRIKEAVPFAMNDADRNFLKHLDDQAKAIIANLSSQPKFGFGWLIPEIEIELLPVEKGTYVRGSLAGSQDEQPPHQVTISNRFWGGKTEITQVQYRKVTGNNPSSLIQRASMPVETVTWSQAVSFCRLLNDREGRAGRLPTGYEYRLPTEAEWEYLCRAGTTTPFSFGEDDNLLHKYGNYCDAAFRGIATWRDSKHNDRFDKVAPAGSYPPNAWGFHDFHGNVSEWCLDRYAKYPKDQVIDPIGYGKRDERVFRGGSWTGAASLCRSGRRTAAAPTYALNSLGFRIILAPSAIADGSSRGLSRILAP